MKTRTDLHTELCSLLGSTHVYFEPPESIKLVYPCIIYSRAKVHTKRSDDQVYTIGHQYELTYITKSAEYTFVEEALIAFRYCEHDRSFTNDNLHHETFTLFYY